MLHSIKLTYRDGARKTLFSPGKGTILEIEHIMIIEAFIFYQGKINFTAKRLGYDKSTMRKKLIKYGLVKPGGGHTDLYIILRKEYIDANTETTGNRWLA